MRYAEKVMLHQMAQQTFTERKAYDALGRKNQQTSVCPIESIKICLELTLG